jgi:D-alanine-D-alanine ligase-like ATP-grasp enzyme
MQLNNSSFALPTINFTRLSPSGLTALRPANTEMKLLILEAKEMGISTQIIDNSDIVTFRYGNHVEYVRNGAPSTNHTPGPRLCANKYLTRTMLKLANLPITNGYDIRTPDTMEYRQTVFNALQKPLAIKPANSTHGAGVKLNVTTFEEMNNWIDYLFTSVETDSEVAAAQVLVEEMAHGSEYRIIATKDKMVAVMSRQPASVIGDGQQTIETLIHIKNQLPIRNISQDVYPHISIDGDMKQILANQNLELDSIPAAGQKIQLRTVSNIMAGGDAVDMTDQAHPSVAALATQITRALPGMSFVGIDFMTTDLTADQQTVDCAIIEVNSAPEYAMHDMPMVGKKRFVAKEVLMLMFNELR